MHFKRSECIKQHTFRSKRFLQQEKVFNVGRLNSELNVFLGCFKWMKIKLDSERFPIY